MQPGFIGFSICLFVLAIEVPQAFSQQAKPQSAYQATWDEVCDLLRKREYGNALAKLDTLSREGNRQDEFRQIEADKKAIRSLQVLERLVYESAAQLKPGSAIKISGASYIVISYEKTAKGDWLYLKPMFPGQNTRKSIADLPADTWVELAEANLTALDNAPLTLGIFLGFDRMADLKAARKLLNRAATQGENVTGWIARLDAIEAAKSAAISDRKEKRGVDPVVGHWSLILPSGLQVNVQFRGDGTAIRTVPLQTLMEMRRQKIPPPVNNPEKGTWVKDADGSYRLTTASGFTASFLLQGDKLGPAVPKPGGKQATGTRQVKRP